MLLSWTALGNDMAIFKSLPTRAAAEAWLDEPVLPGWAYRTCAPPGNETVTAPKSEPSAVVFGVLWQDGAHMAEETKPMDVTRLINTIKLLNGECALGRCFSSTLSARAWLLSPVLSAWVAPFVRRKRPLSESLAAPAHDRAVADGVLFVSSSEDGGSQPDAVSTLTAGLAPPTPTHSIFSHHAIQESMPLPMAFVRNPTTGLLPGGAGVGRSVAFTGWATPEVRATPIHVDEGDSQVKAACRPGGSKATSGRCGIDEPLRPGSDFSSSLAESQKAPDGRYSSTATAASDARLFGSSRRRRRDAPVGAHPVWLTAPVGVASVTFNNKMRANKPPPPAIDLDGSSSGEGDDDEVVVVDAEQHHRDRKPKPSPRVKYCMDKLASRVLEHKDSLFVTGGGGVGKTRLLHLLVRQGRLAKSGQQTGLSVVAPTGVAASIAGGVTLHAYLRQAAGCFNELISEEEDAARLYKKMGRPTKVRLAFTSLLLLDEVSMVSSRMLTLLAYAVARAHEELNPGASWKFVAFGDFYQLPPVWRADEDVLDTRGTFSFKSPWWRKLFGTSMLELNYVWRQENLQFIGMLKELRVGVVTPELQAFMERRQDVYARVGGASQGASQMDITHIFPHRAKVDEHNEVCLSSMEVITCCKRVTYKAEDAPVGVNLSPVEVTAQLNRGLMAPEKLELCVGARVASCVSFKQDGVANGMVGTVVRFERVALGEGKDGGSYAVPVVSFLKPSKKEVEVFVPPCAMSLQAVAKDGPYATRFQVPLVLAWGVTMHRCQGLSMDAAVLDLALCFVAGMVYVALSRVRSLAGVHVISFEASKVQADARVTVFYEEQTHLGAIFADCTSTDDDDLCLDDASDLF